MTPEKLRHVLKDATKCEWIYDDGQFIAKVPSKHKATIEGYETDKFSWGSYPAQYVCDCGKCDADKDAKAIATMMNLADSLVELWEACEDVRGFINKSGYKGVIWDRFNEAMAKLSKSGGE